ncbi:hypothetical protein NOS3756_17310 [Nostoc sp. NIES-3756]|uniref:DUF2949 domain-containing protein n=1 Tax=Nostoc sp. NIES-3756 TaxID=1751286 RepID=UPI00071F7E11|nr:DUF2949 domain-containing protein [Nostoc sp. NIES-3756]BAT52790.1 hypothetical protein NOS3756_17310 [Nostoc sp. NIES-3756]BAY39513.1 hypothetical protein NIES2111_38890 [Nostoc sp. NIES-2111]
MMTNTKNKNLELLNFLHKELELSDKDMAVALKHQKFDNGPLPMLLWQYGLVDLAQLEQILDWLYDES